MSGTERDDRTVAVRFTRARYCEAPPFHPDERYPELGFSDRSSGPNAPYAALRQLFVDLGLDRAHAGTAAWNPLRDLIQPGQTVLLKPNFVTSINGSGDDLFAVVTHPSILRAVVDYAHLALEGRGRIVIADAPDMSCDWDALMAAQRLDAIQSFYRERFSFNLEVYDLRNFAMGTPGGPAYASDRVPRPGDPAGSTMVNLGSRSEFFGLPSDRYYGADYNRQETIRHHHGDTHTYCISNTFLQADTVISLPKMKVHKKVGVTLNLKGLVGTTTNKNCLIHYRIGPPSRQGDQVPDGLPAGDQLLLRAQRWLFDRLLARQSRLGDALYAACRSVYRGLVKPFRPVARSTQALDGGNWHGNDSAWRMTADLAKILFFADRTGTLQTTRQRNVLCIVDGIIAGENEGPLAPTARACGCLVAGRNAFAVDLVTTRLMGFDHRRVKQFSILDRTAWDFGFRSAADLLLRIDGAPVPTGHFFDKTWSGPIRPFAAHSGWRGHLELSPANAPPL